MTDPISNPMNSGDEWPDISDSEVSIEDELASTLSILDEDDPAPPTPSLKNRAKDGVVKYGGKALSGIGHKGGEAMSGIKKHKHAIISTMTCFSGGVLLAGGMAALVAGVAAAPSTFGASALAGLVIGLPCILVGAVLIGTGAPYAAKTLMDHVESSGIHSDMKADLKKKVDPVMNTIGDNFQKVQQKGAESAKALQGAQSAVEGAERELQTLEETCSELKKLADSEDPKGEFFEAHTSVDKHREDAKLALDGAKAALLQAEAAQTAVVEASKNAEAYKAHADGQATSAGAAERSKDQIALTSAIKELNSAEGVISGNLSKVEEGFHNVSNQSGAAVMKVDTARQAVTEAMRSLPPSMQTSRDLASVDLLYEESYEARGEANEALETAEGSLWSLKQSVNKAKETQAEGSEIVNRAQTRALKAKEEAVEAIESAAQANDKLSEAIEKVAEAKEEASKQIETMAVARKVEVEAEIVTAQQLLTAANEKAAKALQEAKDAKQEVDEAVNEVKTKVQAIHAEAEFAKIALASTDANKEQAEIEAITGSSLNAMQEADDAVKDAELVMTSLKKMWEEAGTLAFGHTEEEPQSIAFETVDNVRRRGRDANNQAKLALDAVVKGHKEVQAALERGAAAQASVSEQMTLAEQAQGDHHEKALIAAETAIREVAKALLEAQEARGTVVAETAKVKECTGIVIKNAKEARKAIDEVKSAEGDSPKVEAEQATWNKTSVDMSSEAERLVTLAAGRINLHKD